MVLTDLEDEDDDLHFLQELERITTSVRMGKNEKKGGSKSGW
jgi:hypothetical protein